MIRSGICTSVNSRLYHQSLNEYYRLLDVNAPQHERLDALRLAIAYYQLSRQFIAQGLDMRREMKVAA
jgi:hypothetical protein